MRVLVAASSAFPRWKDDPSPGFVYDLSRRLRQMGVEVVVAVPHHPGSRRFENLSGMAVHRFRYFFPSSLERLCYGGGILPNMKKSLLARLQLPLFILAEMFALLGIAKKVRPDIIHAHWILPQGFVAAIVGKLFGIPVVVTAHAGDVFPLNKLVFRMMSMFSLDSVAVITVNSAFTKSAVAKITKKPIRVIPMGVDLGLFSSSSASAASAIRKKYLVRGNLLLFVGRLAEKKGVAYLVSAMAVVIKKFPDAKLVIVGDGPEKPSLQQQAQRLNLSGSVVFAGSVPNNELPAYYRAADAFILPSIVAKSGDTEGLGVVLLEAIAAGTPVIASDVGGIPDIVVHNKTGLLVGQKSPQELAAAISKLLGSSRLRKRLSSAARARISFFSWGKVAEEFYFLFKKLLTKTF